MAKDTVSEQELAEQYGYAKQLFYSDPTLKKLLQDAVKGDWTADKFQAKLRATKWWTSKSDAERKYLALQYGDPATAKQNYNQNYTRIRQLSESLGITYEKSKDKIATAAMNVTAKGWTDEQVRYYLGQYVGFNQSQGYKPGGEAEQTYDQIQQLAYNYGIKLSAHDLETYAKNVVRGLATIDDVRSIAKTKAAASFPMYRDQIKAGQSMTDIAAPYMQQMSQTLELAPGSINLFDPTVRKALTSKGKDGKPAAVPLWQFENQLKEDPRWKKTQNAQDSVTQVAHNILNQFGLTY